MVWCGGGGTKRKKGNGPVPTVRCLGRPVSECVCAFVCSSPVLCWWCMCEGRGQGIPYLFFLHFSFLFITAAAAITAPLRHPTTRNTCSLLSLSRRCTQKGRPRRVGEKNLHEMTHIFLLIFPSPLAGRYSVFDFYSFSNVGRDRVVVFPTTLHHHHVRSVIHHACR